MNEVKFESVRNRQTVSVIGDGSYFLLTTENGIRRLSKNDLIVELGIDNMFAGRLGVAMSTDLSTVSDSFIMDGRLRWNHGIQEEATVLFISDTTADGFTLVDFWAALGTSGLLYLQSPVTASVWQIWEVIGKTDGVDHVAFAVNLLSKGDDFEDLKDINVFFETAAGSSSSLTNWVESLILTTPNDTRPAIAFEVLYPSAPDIDVAVVAKGDGATLAQVPDATGVGGNKRGTRATDFKKSRSVASQVASGTSAVILGGHANTASAIYAIVVGGDNNAATGQSSAILGGRFHNATGTESTIGGGTSNSASGNQSVVCGGQNNSATNNGSTVIGGRENKSDGIFSSAMGMRADTRGTASMVARGVAYSPGYGIAQGAHYPQHIQTANNTTTALSGDSSAVNSTNQVVLPNNSAYVVTGLVVAIDTNNDSKAWRYTAHVVRGAGAGTTALVAAATIDSISNTAGASTWALQIVADTTHGALRFNVTGQAGKTINWTNEAWCVQAVR